MSPYSDYWNVDERYYHGDSVADPHPAGYSDYSRTSFNFRQKALDIIDVMEKYGIDPYDVTFVDLGCSFGYTVEELVDFGVDAYGLDYSEYAVAHAPESIADRILLGDATVPEDVPTSDVYYARYLFCMLDDVEAMIAMNIIQSRDPELVIVELWCTDEYHEKDEYYNDNTLAEWITILGDYSNTVYIT